MIRVACVLDPRYEGGAERYLLRLGEGLDRSSFHATWILPDRPVLRSLVEKARAASIDIVALRAGGLFRAVREARPDVVHLNLPSTYDLSSGAAAIPARIAGARAVVCTEHIVDVAPSRRRALLKAIALPWIARIIAISDAHRRILRERHGVPPGKIRMIRNGVEDPGPSIPPEERPFRIVCVAALEARKGQDILIEALADLRSRGLDARLDVVGDGPERETLEAAVGSRGLSSAVAFVGRLESAWPAYRSAHVVAIPSRREGIPFAALEGLAAGVAVVASALPGLEEVIRTDMNGVLVPPGDSRALADALARLALDPALRKRLALAGREEYETRFTLERMVRETEALYREVLA